MFLLLYLLWIILNGQLTLEIALIGLPVAALVYAFICKFMDYRVSSDLFLARELLKLIRYLAVLLWEILKANVLTIGKVLRFGKEASPAIVSFDVELKTELGRALLANSITLTPGTITVSLNDNHYVVHCLDKKFGEGLETSVFVRLIADMEQDYERFISKKKQKD